MIYTPKQEFIYHHEANVIDPFKSISTILRLTQVVQLQLFQFGHVFGAICDLYNDRVRLVTVL